VTPSPGRPARPGLGCDPTLRHLRVVPWRGDGDLCPEAEGTCVHRNGGYADRVRANARFVIPCLTGSPASRPRPAAGGVTVYNPRHRLRLRYRQHRSRGRQQSNLLRVRWLVLVARLATLPCLSVRDPVSRARRSSGLATWPRPHRRVLARILTGTRRTPLAPGLLHSLPPAPTTGERPAEPPNHVSVYDSDAFRVMYTLTTAPVNSREFNPRPTS